VFGFITVWGLEELGSWMDFGRNSLGDCGKRTRFDVLNGGEIPSLRCTDMQVFGYGFYGDGEVGGVDQS
jgi:hypothetical protein